MLVGKILDEMGIGYSRIDLGIVKLKLPINETQKLKIKEVLRVWELDLLEDQKSILVEKIKSSVLEMIENEEDIRPLKTSHYLSRYLNYNYTYLANVFSQATGACLSDFIIERKIEKAKEMLMYGNLTISEIAWKLNYSSVAHLSNQFTKVTGVRPSKFKKNTQKIFSPLGQVGLLEVA